MTNNQKKKDFWNFSKKKFVQSETEFFDYKILLLEVINPKTEFIKEMNRVKFLEKVINKVSNKIKKL